MMFGTAATTYTAPGITSTASRAAQSGPTKFVTSDATGNLATSDFGVADIGNLNSSVNNLNSSVNNLNANVAGLWGSVGALQQSVYRAYEGSAVAIANTAPTISRESRFGIAVKWGNFRGQNAIGGMAQFRVTPNVVLNASIGGGLRYGGVGGGVGGLYEW
jgi:outer membrane murein-binding lipoprotein Lpp